MNLTKSYPYILIVGSIVGLAASFLLMLDTITLIKNPQAELACNLNPFISCTSVATTWQSSIFGFPNPLLGIMAFSMLLAIGIMLIFGGSDSSVFDKISGQNKARRPLWLFVNLGTLAAMIFVAWFFFESVYSIGSLCLYCMIVWIVTWPIFLYTTIWNFKEGNLPKIFDSIMNFSSKNHFKILTVLYVAAILLIFIRFREFFIL